VAVDLNLEGARAEDRFRRQGVPRRRRDVAREVVGHRLLEGPRRRKRAQIVTDGTLTLGGLNVTAQDNVFRIDR